MQLAHALRVHDPPIIVYETLERIFEVDAEAGAPMRSYFGFGSDRQAIRRYVQYTLDNLAFADLKPNRQRILDAGCGFGLSLVIYGLYGAAGLCGIDLDAAAIRFSQRYRGVLPGDLSDRLRLEVGNVAALRYSDESFDVVTSFEAVSHYLDLDRALHEFQRVLRPGGVLIISDGNNGLNPLYAHRIRALWRAAEEGPGYRTISGHSIGKPYRDRREEIIRQYSPDLPSEEVRRLAFATFGLVKSEILAAVDRYMAEGVLPARVDTTGGLPTDPDGATHERLFNPYALGDKLATMGFEVSVLGHWGGASGRRVVRVANSLLAAGSRLTMYTARGFRIAAVRTGLRAPTATGGGSFSQ
jgi:SAM-dependent methyltransferase